MNRNYVSDKVVRRYTHGKIDGQVDLGKRKYIMKCNLRRAYVNKDKYNSQVGM